MNHEKKGRIESGNELHGPRHVFDRSGLAPLSDLSADSWRELFESLEREQNAFLGECQSLFSPGYIWPRDPLHQWSRVWEYPYIFHHLKHKVVSRLGGPLPVVVDLGSGATFFPFAVAHLGCKVVCVDNDPSSQATMQRAFEAFSSAPGEIDFKLTDGSTLPLPDGAADVLYCISVLEHIPQFEKTIDEVTRVLRPGGLFLLTFDVDLQGNSQIGEKEYKSICEYIFERFEYIHPETTIHPRNILHSKTGPYPLRLSRRIALMKAVGLGWLAEPLFGKLSYGGAEGVHMAVQGMVLSKRPGI